MTPVRSRGVVFSLLMLLLGAWSDAVVTTKAPAKITKVGTFELGGNISDFNGGLNLFKETPISTPSKTSSTVFSIFAFK